MQMLQTLNLIVLITTLYTTTFAICQETKGSISAAYATDDCEKCVTQSIWPKNIDQSESNPENLGKICERSKVCGGDYGRLMYNGNAHWGCFKCCKNHYWNGESCQQCAPNTVQDEGVSENCEPDDTRHPSPKPTKRPVTRLEPYTVNEQDHSVPRFQYIPDWKSHSEPRWPPKKLVVANCTSTSADLEWCFFCTSCRLIQIRIHEESGGKRIVRSEYVSTLTSRHHLKNLKPGFNYCVEIRGLYEGGGIQTEADKGPWSDGVAFTAQAVAKPTKPKKFKVTQSDGVVKVKWQDPRHSFKKQVRYKKENELPVYVTFHENILTEVELPLPSRGRYAISMCYIGIDLLPGPWTSLRNINYEPKIGQLVQFETKRAPSNGQSHTEDKERKDEKPRKAQGYLVWIENDSESDLPVHFVAGAKLHAEIPLPFSYEGNYKISVKRVKQGDEQVYDRIVKVDSDSCNQYTGCWICGIGLVVVGAAIFLFGLWKLKKCHRNSAGDPLQMYNGVDNAVAENEN